MKVSRMFPNHPGDSPGESKFPKRLRAQRTANGLTQDDLAQMLGTSRLVIAKWERGTSEPNLAGIVRLCSLLDVSADYLLGRIDEM